MPSSPADERSVHDRRALYLQWNLDESELRFRGNMPGSQGEMFQVVVEEAADRVPVNPETVPGWLRRLVVHRDGGRCRYPGCGHTRWLQVHHIQHWAQGGTTNLDNLILLCSFHHRFVHEHHWRITGDPNHRVVFRKPDRTPYPGPKPGLDPRLQQLANTDQHRGSRPRLHPPERQDSSTAACGTTVKEHMFVLGIDPGLSITGYGMIEGPHPPKALLAGVIRTDPDSPTVVRLVELYRGLSQVIADAKPDVVALETIFTNRNLQTASSVGRASGVAMLAAGEAGLNVHEYVPTAIKSAVTGDGSANKSRVQEMVARLLSLQEAPKPADASDALAIAICHLRAAPLEAAR